MTATGSSCWKPRTAISVISITLNSPCSRYRTMAKSTAAETAQNTAVEPEPCVQSPSPV